MKKVIFFLAALALAAPVFAGPVDANRAAGVASSFFRANATKSASPRLVWTGSVEMTRAGIESPALYVFEEEGSGFVVVSGDDVAVPVLGYSESGKFVTEGMPDNIRTWFESYERQIAYMRDKGLKQDSETAKEWKRFEEGKNIRMATPVVALSTPLWDQTAPYNNYCDKVSGQSSRPYTGCVATATAEVMYHHKWPVKGNGTLPSYNYELGSKTISVTGYELTETYKWDKMRNKYTGSYTEEEGNAVARLMRDVGVMVQMEYSNQGSGAMSEAIGAGLINYMGYDSCIHIVYRDEIRDSEWNALLKNDLDNNMPVVMGASNSYGSNGHEFVVDGYDSDGKFYVNWGWSGSDNGFFEMSAFCTSSSSDDDFSYYQDATFGIKPATSSSFRVGDLYIMGYNTGSSEPYYGLKIVSGSTEVGQSFKLGCNYVWAYGYEPFDMLYGAAIVDANDNVKEFVSEVYKDNFDPEYVYGFSDGNELDCTISQQPLPGDRLTIVYGSWGEKWRPCYVEKYYVSSTKGPIYFYERPMIYCPKETYEAGELFDLQIVNLEEDPYSVTWSFDGSSVTGTYVKLTSGVHTVKAVVKSTSSDKYPKTLIQKITVL